MDQLGDIARKVSQAARPVRIVESHPLPARMGTHLDENEETNVCSICRGLGFTRKNVPFGHPQFGKAIMCQCRIVESARRTLSRTYTWLGANADVAHEFETMTFESFHPNANSREVAMAYRKARGYAEILKGQIEGQRNGLFVGPFGVGKTHLACATLNTVRRAGIGCLFASGNELFQALYDSNFDESILHDATTIPLLCLDDLDKMQQKDDGSYQKTTLFTLLNQRYVAHKPTIITANADEDWRKWLHPAVLSRLFGKGKVEAIGMQGQDYRMIGGG